MKEDEFTHSWFEEAKGNDDIDEEVLEMISQNLEDSLDEDSLLDNLLEWANAKGDRYETN